MSGLPAPTDFSWTFNSSSPGEDAATQAGAVPVDPALHHSMAQSSSSSSSRRRPKNSNASSSVLIWKADSESDLGTLSCVAENQLGEAASPCLFKIVAARESRRQALNECKYAF